ncbi:MAG: hypothetical protein ABI835_11410, partial [Chloroflexota bacterium]
CQIQYVGGDHAADSCVIYVAEDRLLFLGDCLYTWFIPTSHYTVKRLFPVLDALLAFDAEHFIQGHTAAVTTRAEFEEMTGKMRLAGALVQQFGTNEAAIFAEVAAQTGKVPDEDDEYFVLALIAGVGVE